MDEFKSLGDILADTKQKPEIYSSDQKKRKYRSQKGRFTRNQGTFDFIHLIKNWETLVGALMAKNTIPLKISYQTLYINAKHSVFAQELSFLAPKIIEKIEKSHPHLKGKIKKLKFSFSHYSSQDFDTKKENNSKASPGKKKKKELHPYSPEYQKIKNHASDLFADIEDPEVKEALINFVLQN